MAEAQILNQNSAKPFLFWRRERLPTPVFWPGEFHGLYSPWGRKELDTTEQLSLSLGAIWLIGGSEFTEGKVIELS